MSKTEENWEKEFDKLFLKGGIENYRDERGRLKVRSARKKYTYETKTVKSFCRNLITAALEEGKAIGREEVVGRIDTYGDIWRLRLTAEESDSGCPVFERVNRQLKVHLLTPQND